MVTYHHFYIDDHHRGIDHLHDQTVNCQLNTFTDHRHDHCSHVISMVLMIIMIAWSNDHNLTMIIVLQLLTIKMILMIIMIS